MTTRSETLGSLLAKARAAGPQDRISYRDPIAEHGDAAIAELTSWLTDASLRSFAIRTIGRAAQHGSRERAIAALRTIDASAPLHARQDVETELARLGARLPAGSADPDALFGDVLAEAAYGVARRRDPSSQGLRIGQIEEGLLAEGYTVRGENPGSVLRSALNRAQHRFERSAPATWRWLEPKVDPTVGLSGGDLADAAYDVARQLDTSRKGMHYEEIKEELLRRGAIIRGPSRGQTMSGALTGDPARFEQLGEGLWRWR